MKSALWFIFGCVAFAAFVVVMVPLITIRLWITDAQDRRRKSRPRPTVVMLIGPDGRPARPLFVSRERMARMFGDVTRDGGGN